MNAHDTLATLDRFNAMVAGLEGRIAIGDTIGYFPLFSRDRRRGPAGYGKVVEINPLSIHGSEPTVRIELSGGVAMIARVADTDRA